MNFHVPAVVDFSLENRYDCNIPGGTPRAAVHPAGRNEKEGISMIAAVLNAVLVIVGSAVGLLFKGKIKESYSDAIMIGLGLCVMAIGITGAVKTENMLVVIVSMVVGIIIGELLHILIHFSLYLLLSSALEKRSRISDGYYTYVHFKVLGFIF